MKAEAARAGELILAVAGQDDVKVRDVLLAAREDDGGLLALTLTLGELAGRLAQAHSGEGWRAQLVTALHLIDLDTLGEGEPDQDGS